MNFSSEKIVETLRKKYPVGARVKLVKMDDTQAPPVGTCGTVRGVDDTGSILVSWDNGSSLNIVYGEDQCVLCENSHLSIKEAILLYCKQKHPSSCCIPTNELGYLEVDILFENNGQEDETEFDIKPAHFDYVQGKCKELEDLWKEFCKENNFKQNSVISIRLKGGW